jgi:hypothetical protein
MTTYTPQCLFCVHLQPNKKVEYPATYACDAFPDGLPRVILRNRFDHRQSYPGDHGIRWEAKDPEMGSLFDPAPDEEDEADAP